MRRPQQQQQTHSQSLPFSVCLSVRSQPSFYQQDFYEAKIAALEEELTEKQKQLDSIEMNGNEAAAIQVCERIK